MKGLSMSTVSTSQLLEPDPFHYGWRYVRVHGPNGKETFDQVPLTLEDVLHPELGDFIVHSDPHDVDRTYLRDVFECRLVEKPRAVVVGDCRVDWNLPGIRPLGPDIAVFLDVKKRKLWATLNVAAERAKPGLVVEITSPETRKNDVETKVDYYHRAKVPVYVIADAVQEDPEHRRLRLIAYRYTRPGYRRMAPDAHGRIWLDAVGVWLGVTQDRRLGYDRLACFDAETGDEIGDYTALSAALGAEKEARVRADHRAQSAAARASKQAARAKTEAARAKTEAARAEAEANARAQAEARVRELEAALRRLERKQ
jgi:colicin import membrane protein